MIHKPVLVKEVLEYLDPKENENFIDATVGGAGHAIEILRKNGPSGRLLGIDLDKDQIENSRLSLSDFNERIVLVHDSYSNIKEVVKNVNLRPVDGILLDLGFSSWHLEEAGRGFSFQKDEELDMRYNNKNGLTAQIIVNEYPEEKIEEILRNFGEEKFARQIAKKIIDQRKFKKISSTFELKNIIQEAISKKFHYGKIHFATRTFQALRIAVNKELDNLNEFLPQSIEILSKGGRLAIISFHSLEDRIVKHFLKEAEDSGHIKILTKKPIIASDKEILTNPRARSAKLRAIIKI